jgi:hypothetical protein
MTWETIKAKPKTSLPEGRVLVGTHVMGVGKRAYVSLRVRQPPPWLLPGKAISIAVGADEHAGMLRLAPGPDRVVPKYKGNGDFRLLISAWPGAPANFQTALCDCEIAPDALLISLPWMPNRLPVSGAPKLGDVVAASQPARPPVPKPPAPDLTPPAAARAATAGVAAASKPIRATRATIIAWAGERGITGKLDLALVNKKRRDLMQSPFELDEPGARGG